MVAYLAVALSFTSERQATDHYKRVRIDIHDRGSVGFVTPQDIDEELGMLSERIRRSTISEINTLDIERRVMEIDKIQDVNCVALNDGTLQIEVVPLVPEARIFDINSGRNFYINRAGKRMMASSKFRMDVPVVVGYFEGDVCPASVLPVLDYMNAHPSAGALMSSLKVQRNGDILLVPMIKGHVVNLGDTLDLDNKFLRLLTFYDQVLPVKGWEYYDTLTMKWSGQLVAHKHVDHGPDHVWPTEQEVYIDDASTMEVAVAAGNPPQP